MSAVIPYIVAAGGIQMLLGVAMTKVSGLPSSVFFRLVPAVLGGALLWVSAIMLVGGM